MKAMERKNMRQTVHHFAYSNMPEKVFLSYACQDKMLKDKLEDHLMNLKYRGIISTWSNSNIQAGETETQQIDLYLNDARIILLLISSHFMASEQCYQIEMKQAFELQKERPIDIIPILLRPILHTDEPFATLVMLPTNKKPIVLWRNRDLAFVDVALGIEKVAIERRRLLESSRGSDAPKAFIFPGISRLISGLKRRRYYEQSIQSYRDALSIDPHNTDALQGMGNALFALKLYDEALHAYQQAIQYSSQMGSMDTGMRITEQQHSRREEENKAIAYAGLGNTLAKLGRYSEATTAYKQAINLDTTVTFNFKDFLYALHATGQTQEIAPALERAKQFGFEENKKTRK
jgi:tetratricopeptide (TPR) repeat protein